VCEPFVAEPLSVHHLQAGTTTTLEGVERLKERLHLLYIEQLCEREKPEGRSGSSWDSILSTYRVAFEGRLKELETVESIWNFAEKCLKRPHLLEAFRFFGAEEVHETAVSSDTVLACVHPTEECERDIQLQETLDRKVFKQHLNKSSEVIDLE